MLRSTKNGIRSLKRFILQCAGCIKMNKRIVNSTAFVVLLAVEIFIALFVHDRFVRPYIGDILGVIEWRRSRQYDRERKNAETNDV